jgi:hypothetical protein
MGDELLDRMFAEFHKIPAEAQGLAALLARKAHDKDAQPCCWLSWETLTKTLYGEVGPAAQKRYERLVDKLVAVGVVRRARGPHEGRPKGRACPRDGRRVHLELFPTDGGEAPASDELIDATRRIPEAELIDATRRISEEIVDAPPRVDDESNRRRAGELIDATRRSRQETPTESPKDLPPQPPKSAPAALLNGEGGSTQLDQDELEAQLELFLRARVFLGDVEMPPDIEGVTAAAVASVFVDCLGFQLTALERRRLVNRLRRIPEDQLTAVVERALVGRVPDEVAHPLSFALGRLDRAETYIAEFGVPEDGWRELQSAGPDPPPASQRSQAKRSRLSIAGGAPVQPGTTRKTGRIEF